MLINGSDTIVYINTQMQLQLRLRLQRHTNSITVTIINKEIRSQNIRRSA